MATKNEETIDQAYLLNDELKELLYQNLTNKPYGEVFKVLEFLGNNKDGIILESQLNLVLNYLGKLPYGNVIGFFQSLPTVLLKADEIEAGEPEAQIDEGPQDENETTEAEAREIKAEGKPKPELVKEEASFEDELGDLDKFI